MDKASSFQQLVWNYYKTHGRHDLLWRHASHVNNPYRIVVSELMLQQTQVSRVKDAYPVFIKTFPSFASLARASNAEVLRVWQGMGYNRRARYLKQIAEIVTREYRGRLPDDPVLLYAMPGIGEATAGSITAFAFNKPIPFIETNIRRVFIKHFFPRAKKVHDDEILKWVRNTLDIKNPREWYYALMDYGTHLARVEKNHNKKSAHYRAQSTFKGSTREIRGKIVAILLECESLREEALLKKVSSEREKAMQVIESLVGEGFIIRRNNRIYLA